jgi:hypothetical protein
LAKLFVHPFFELDKKICEKLRTFLIFMGFLRFFWVGDLEYFKKLGSAVLNFNFIFFDPGEL